MGQELLQMHSQCPGNQFLEGFKREGDPPLAITWLGRAIILWPKNLDLMLDLAGEDLSNEEAHSVRECKHLTMRKQIDILLVAWSIRAPH